MKASVLFSGGKDSSLSAILLEPFFNVELVTCNFGLVPKTGEIARDVAQKLGFKHRVLNLDISVLEHAFELIVRDGFPKNAINYIHEHAVESLAVDENVFFIADGIRRDDRVPVLDNSKIRSIEDRFGMGYICPLKGYSRSSVNHLVDKYLVIEEAKSESIIKSDYETELRELIKLKLGANKIKEIFPEHIQSHVLSRKK